MNAKAFAANALILRYRNFFYYSIFPLGMSAENAHSVGR